MSAALYAAGAEGASRRGAYRGRPAAFATWCYIRYDAAMSRTISQRELRNDSAAVLREVQAGHTIIVCRNGVPVAELRPVPPRRFVPRAVIADAAKRAPRIDAKSFRADLDSVVEQSIDG
jgi:prevent-host-death family protein